MFRKIALFILLSLVSGYTVSAQKKGYYIFDSLDFIKSGTQIMPFSLAGGFHCPQFSPCDLNDDGKKDLVVYDKIDGSISTFIRTGGPGEVKYVLDNRYAEYFPKLKPFAWMLMRDYNNDGYEDIFTTGPQGYVIYKNISFTVSGRPAFVELPPLYYRNTNPPGHPIQFNRMSTPNIHLPGIYDIDFDGDLDIMSYSNIGGAISMYKNFRSELNLTDDSMYFIDADRCYGYFTDFDCNMYVLNDCSDKDPDHYNFRHTNGSSITLFDANDDGDVDMLIGNEGCSHMTMLYNAKNFNTHLIDSFYAYDTNYVNSGNRADVSIYPAAYFLDVDGDDKRDLIYAPNSTNFQYYIENINQIRWFRNTGTDLAPVWAQQQPLFTEDMIDLGAKNQWACADWDKDGDLDCIASTNGNSYLTKDTADRILLYENKGSRQKPLFELVNSNFGNFIPEQINNLTIAIADMDNDGKLDLVCGNDKGEILYYRNTSSTDNTLNPTFIYANSSYPGFNIDVGGFSAPAVGDLNDDGLPDLVIGRSDSMISHYRNTGTPSQPDFSIVTSRFGNVKPIDSIGLQYIYDDTFAIIGYIPVYEKTVYSKPVLMDIDGDDTMELIVGNSLGTLRMYKINPGRPTTTFKMIDSFHYRNIFQGGKSFNTDFGSYIAPCLADLDGDTVPEIIISSVRGGIHYLKPDFKYDHRVSVKPVHAIRLNAYPNPAASKVEIMMPQETEILSFHVYNTLGQEIPITPERNAHIMSFDVQNVAPGFYIVQIRSTGGKVFTARFQVIHK